MLTLIRREIRDQFVYVLACWVASGIAAGIMVFTTLWGVRGAGFMFAGLMMSLLCIGLCGLGAAQMYSDRANRVSSLLATLATTRGRILAARVLVGALTDLGAIVLFVVPVVIVLRLAAPPLEFYARMIWEISVAAALTGFACYGIGLLVGWTTNRTWLVFGGLLLLALLMSFLVVKGFGPGAMLLLLLFIAAVLTRVWHTFTSASL